MWWKSQLITGSLWNTQINSSPDTSNQIHHVQNHYNHCLSFLFGYSDSVLMPRGVWGRGAPNETNYCQVELWPHSHEKLSIWLLLDGLAVLFCFVCFFAITTLPCQKNKTVNTTSIDFFMQLKIEVFFFHCHTFSWTWISEFHSIHCCIHSGFNESSPPSPPL